MSVNALSPSLRQFRGRTTHVRHVPFERRFSYRLFMIDVDIDRLDEANAQTRLLSINKPNLYSFYQRDHGRRDGNPLRPWAEDKFRSAGVNVDGGAIRLATFPRHWGYRFAPLSLWFGFGDDHDLRGVIYEVNNTFGETHNYVAKTEGGCSKHESDKRFHVSPFFDVTGKYRFTVHAPEDTMSVVVESRENGAPVHMANIRARAVPATSANFARAAMSMPFSSLGVTAGIHWEALRIWRRGAGYRPKPTPPSEDLTIAAPLGKGVVSES